MVKLAWRSFWIIAGISGLLGITVVVLQTSLQPLIDAQPSPDLDSLFSEVSSTDDIPEAISNTLDSKQDQGLVKEQPSLWQVKEVESQPAHTSNAIARSHGISMAKDWHQALEKEAPIRLSLPHKDYEVQITAQTQSSKTTKFYKGHLVNANGHFPVTFTVGEKQGFATVITPEGEYTIEFNGEEGVVYRNPNIQELTWDERPDYLIPEIFVDEN